MTIKALELDALRHTLVLIGAGIESLAENEQQVVEYWRAVERGMSFLQSGRVDLAAQIAHELRTRAGERSLSTRPEVRSCSMR